MSSLPYVRFDPTGNITVFIITPVSRPLQPGLAAKIMNSGRFACEQVGFLEPPCDGGARLHLQMMGGEFCGNAAMSAAAYIAFLDGLKPGQTAAVPLEVSGAEGVLNCTARSVPGGWEGTVPMPAVNAVEGRNGLVFMHMNGILHIILRKSIPDAEAETLLRSLAQSASEDAVGLLQWADGFLKPLVLVKSTGTLVWETGCGSGSAAVGAYEALRSGNGTTATPVRQPGGTITVQAENKDGHIVDISVTGHVKMLEYGMIDI
ncbi:MAG: hypothetical protein Q4G19_07610 [Clostridia bacterium]|nr:hypothetical protein [Clostridia bacterium]